MAMSPDGLDLGALLLYGALGAASLLLLRTAPSLAAGIWWRVALHQLHASLCCGSPRVCRFVRWEEAREHPHPLLILHGNTLIPF